jgi:hypothetical protein
MGKHERHDDAEGQWAGENLLPQDDFGQQHDGKHRREDGTDEAPNNA